MEKEKDESERSKQQKAEQEFRKSRYNTQKTKTLYVLIITQSRA